MLIYRVLFLAVLEKGDFNTIDEKVMEAKLRQYIRDSGCDRSGQCIPDEESLRVVGQHIRRQEKSEEVVKYLLNLASTACRVNYRFETQVEYDTRLGR